MMGGMSSLSFDSLFPSETGSTSEKRTGQTQGGTIADVTSLPARWSDPLAELDADARTLKTAWESSPLAYVSTWRSPVLLIQGDDDRNVPFAQTVSLARALRKQGVEFEELVFPDEIHGFLLHRHWLEAYKAEADFFERHLKSTTPAHNAPQH